MSPPGGGRFGAVAPEVVKFDHTLISVLLAAADRPALLDALIRLPWSRLDAKVA